MGDRDGTLGVLDRIQAGLLVAVRDVDEHSDLVHLLDDVAPVELRDAVGGILPATGGDVVLHVVGELDDADAQAVKGLHQVDVVLEWRGVLESPHHRGAPRCRDGFDVVRAEREADEITVLLEQATPVSDAGQGLARVLPDREGDVHTVHPALAQLEKNDPGSTCSLPGNRSTACRWPSGLLLEE